LKGAKELLRSRTFLHPDCHQPCFVALALLPEMKVMASSKAAELLELAEQYCRAKMHAGDPSTRAILAEMERSYRVLAHSQEALERSKRQVEGLGGRPKSRDD
jgi:hypothetical protein